MKEFEKGLLKVAKEMVTLLEEEIGQDKKMSERSSETKDYDVKVSFTIPVYKAKNKDEAEEKARKEFLSRDRELLWAEVEEIEIVENTYYKDRLKW